MDDSEFDGGPAMGTGPLHLGSMLRREQQRLRERRQQSSASPLSRIMYIALYLYMARLGFTCFALFPGGLGVVVQAIYSRYYAALTSGDAYPKLLQEIEWTAMCTQRGGIDAAVAALRTRALPAVIRNAPSLPEQDVAAALRSLYARSNYTYNSKDTSDFDDINTLRAQRDGNNVFSGRLRHSSWDNGLNTYSSPHPTRHLSKKEADSLFKSKDLLRVDGQRTCDSKGRGYWQWRLALPDIAGAPTAALELSASLLELLAAAMPHRDRSGAPAIAPVDILLTGGYNASEHTRFDPSERFIFQVAGGRVFTIAPPLLLDKHNPPPSQHRMHGHGAYASVSAAATCSSESAPHSSESAPRDAPLWEVELLPGDVLYLPAYYLHSSTHAVATPCGSLSLSAAPPGAAAAELQYALQKVQLPFAGADSRGVRLVGLGGMVRTVLAQWGQRHGDFLDGFERRVRGSMAGGGLPLALHSPPCSPNLQLCSPLHRRMAAHSSRHSVAAQQLVNVLVGRAPYMPPALRRLVLFEYVEAVVGEIFAGEPSGPCLLLDVVRSCL